MDKSLLTWETVWGWPCHHLKEYAFSLVISFNLYLFFVVFMFNKLSLFIVLRSRLPVHFCLVLKGNYFWSPPSCPFSKVFGVFFVDYWWYKWRSMWKFNQDFTGYSVHVWRVPRISVPFHWYLEIPNSKILEHF